MTTAVPSMSSRLPPTINRAIHFMHQHADEPITISDIARHSTVSVRTLQEGFQKHIGRSPLNVLRRIRLDRAHEELRAGDHYRHSVGAIAHRWGFGHLGRFASTYRATFGEPPSLTLRAQVWTSTR
jgi:transcriptional regulator GlxA family with amidase domain